MNVTRWLCEKIAAKLPARHIWDREGGTIYLSRYYLFGGPRDLESLDSQGSPTEGTEWKKTPFGVNIMLHRFHRSDDDAALHNHPWKWSFSIILAGGYMEERRYAYYKSERAPWDIEYAVRRRSLKPFSLNVIRGTDYHRVDLLERDCWTLFIAGPKAASWSFWDRKTNVVTPWKLFIQQRRGLHASA